MFLFQAMSKLNLNKVLNTASSTPNSAIFAGGAGGSGGSVAITELFKYINDTISPGTNLLLGTYAAAGVGTNTFGLVSAGYNNTALAVANTSKYLYSNNTVIGGTNLQTPRYQLSAVGSTQAGIFAGGTIGNGYLTNSDKYNYSNDTVIPTTVLTVGKVSVSAAGNTVVGIFSGGYYPFSNTTDIYNYSTDTSTVGATLASARYAGAAAGNTTSGIFSAGTLATWNNSALSEKYTYNTNTFIAATSLGLAISALAATGNNVSGIFSGGSYVNYTNKYTYANDTVIASTLLSSAKAYMAAMSTSPGGLGLTLVTSNPPVTTTGTLAFATTVLAQTNINSLLALDLANNPGSVIGTNSISLPNGTVKTYNIRTGVTATTAWYTDFGYQLVGQTQMSTTVPPTNANYVSPIYSFISLADAQLQLQLFIESMMSPWQGLGGWFFCYTYGTVTTGGTYVTTPWINVVTVTPYYVDSFTI